MAASAKRLARLAMDGDVVHLDVVQLKSMSNRGATDPGAGFERHSRYGATRGCADGGVLSEAAADDTYSASRQCRHRDGDDPWV